MTAPRPGFAARKAESEHALQLACTRFLALALPADVLFSAVDHAARLSPRQAGNRKARGVIRGQPDYRFILPPNGQSAEIELKREGAYLTAEQKDWRERAIAAGARYVVCRSVQDVAETLEEWGVRLRARPQ